MHPTSLSLALSLLLSLSLRISSKSNQTTINHRVSDNTHLIQPCQSTAWMPPSNRVHPDPSTFQMVVRWPLVRTARLQVRFYKTSVPRGIREHGSDTPDWLVYGMSGRVPVAVRAWAVMSRGEARPSRRCKRAKPDHDGKLPSATHYLGYVEENETPDMIMRKFAELDAMQKQAPRTLTSEGPSIAPNNGCLSEEDMLKLFKQTSMFNVRSTVQPAHPNELGNDSHSELEEWEELGDDWDEPAVDAGDDTGTLGKVSDLRDSS